MNDRWFEVAGYRLDAGRFYHPQLHLWLERSAPDGRVRVGFDPLGRETRGDVVELSLVEPGSHVDRGQPFGSLEAAKFVGPLEAPVSGRITAINPEVIANPGLLNQDPNRTWLVEVELAELSELEGLLTGEERLRPWFAAEVERFKRQGAIAE